MVALLQALSLTTAPWLCHRRVIRVAPDMLSRHTFSLSLTVLEPGTEICSNGRQTIAILRSGALINITSNPNKSLEIHSLGCLLLLLLKIQEATYRGMSLESDNMVYGLLLITRDIVHIDSSPVKLNERSTFRLSRWSSLTWDWLEAVTTET